MAELYLHGRVEYYLTRVVGAIVRRGDVFERMLLFVFRCLKPNGVSFWNFGYYINHEQQVNVKLENLISYQTMLYVTSWCYLKGCNHRIKFIIAVESMDPIQKTFLHQGDIGVTCLLATCRINFKVSKFIVSLFR